MEVSPGGGSTAPEPDPAAEGVLFVVEGGATLSVAGRPTPSRPAAYAYLPPATPWQLRNDTESPVRFHSIRKAYEPVEGIPAPDPLVRNERDIAPTADARNAGPLGDHPLRRPG